MPLSGSICAIATPFRPSDDAIDLPAFAGLIDHLIDAGTSAIVLGGSTGEAAMLDAGEFEQLLAAGVSHVGGRVPTLAGTGLSGTRNTIAQTQRARDMGVDGALVATPPYVRPTQEGLYRHYCEVAEHGGLPVVLYNVPSRTACDMLPDTVARLARHGNIVGIKEAVSEPARMQALLALRGADFVVLSGDDASAARAMLAGADGVVSVTANVDPARMARLARLCRTDPLAAQALDGELQALYALLGCEPNPTPLKWCLAQLGHGQAQLRLPLLPLNARHHAAGRAALVSLGLVEASAASGRLAG